MLEISHWSIVIKNSFSTHFVSQAVVAEKLVEAVEESVHSVHSVYSAHSVHSVFQPKFSRHRTPLGKL